ISNYFPNSVIEGMLAGIGIIIILKQIPHALGYDARPFSSEEVFENGYSWASISSYLSTLFASLHLGAVIVTLISLSILILWDKVPSLKKFKLMPGALVAVTVGILTNELYNLSGSSLAISSEHLVTLLVPQSTAD